MNLSRHSEARYEIKVYLYTQQASWQRMVWTVRLFGAGGNP